MHHREEGQVDRAHERSEVPGEGQLLPRRGVDPAEPLQAVAGGPSRAPEPGEAVGQGYPGPRRGEPGLEGAQAAPSRDPEVRPHHERGAPGVRDPAAPLEAAQPNQGEAQENRERRVVVVVVGPDRRFREEHHLEHGARHVEREDREGEDRRGTAVLHEAGVAAAEEALGGQEEVQGGQCEARQGEERLAEGGRQEHQAPESHRDAEVVDRVRHRDVGLLVGLGPHRSPSEVEACSEGERPGEHEPLPRDLLEVRIRGEVPGQQRQHEGGGGQGDRPQKVAGAAGGRGDAGQAARRQGGRHAEGDEVHVRQAGGTERSAPRQPHSVDVAEGEGGGRHPAHARRRQGHRDDRERGRRNVRGSGLLGQPAQRGLDRVTKGRHRRDRPRGNEQPARRRRVERTHGGRAVEPRPRSGRPGARRHRDERRRQREERQAGRIEEHIEPGAGAGGARDRSVEGQDVGHERGKERSGPRQRPSPEEQEAHDHHEELQGREVRLEDRAAEGHGAGSEGQDGGGRTARVQQGRQPGEPRVSALQRRHAHVPRRGEEQHGPEAPLPREAGQEIASPRRGLREHDDQCGADGEGAFPEAPLAQGGSNELGEHERLEEAERHRIVSSGQSPGQGQGDHDARSPECFPRRPNQEALGPGVARHDERPVSAFRGLEHETGGEKWPLESRRISPPSLAQPEAEGQRDERDPHRRRPDGPFAGPDAQERPHDGCEDDCRRGLEGRVAPVPDERIGVHAKGQEQDGPHDRCRQERVVVSPQGEGTSAEEPVSLPEPPQCRQIPEREGQEQEPEGAERTPEPRPPRDRGQERLEIRLHLGEEDHHDDEPADDGEERARDERGVDEHGCHEEGSGVLGEGGGPGGAREERALEDDTGAHGREGERAVDEQHGGPEPTQNREPAEPEGGEPEEREASKARHQGVAHELQAPHVDEAQVGQDERSDHGPDEAVSRAPVADRPPEEEGRHHGQERGGRERLGTEVPLDERR